MISATKTLGLLAATIIAAGCGIKSCQAPAPTPAVEPAPVVAPDTDAAAVPTAGDS